MSHMHLSSDCSDFHDVVRDYYGQRPTWRLASTPVPEIVVLCGSTRFFDEFRWQNLRLTIEGKIVLSIGCDTKADGDLFGVTDVENLKRNLDSLHKRKIDLADRVLVLNVGGYIGESTRGEIDYAEKHHKTIAYLEPIYPSMAAAEAILSKCPHSGEEMNLGDHSKCEETVAAYQPPLCINCGHEHQGERWLGICIGCPCDVR